MYCVSSLGTLERKNVPRPLQPGCMLSPGGPWQAFVSQALGLLRPTSLIPCRAAIRQVNSTNLVTGLRTVDDQLDRSLAKERLLAILASAFASLVLVSTGSSSVEPTMHFPETS